MSEFEKWESMRDNPIYRAQLAPALNQLAKPGDSLVVGAIGSVGYYTNLYIYDMNGLVTPKVAQREVTGPLIMPGHDKHVPYNFFLKDRPTFILATFAPVTVDRAATMIENFRLRPESADYVPHVERVNEIKKRKGIYVMVFYRRVDGLEEHRQGWEAARAATISMR